MNKLLGLIVSIIAIVVTVVPLMAQDVIRPFGYGMAINVRSGPGVEYSVRGTLLDGQLTLTGRSDFDITRGCTGISSLDLDMWLRVDYHGVEGWVSLCTVEMETDLSTVPVVEATYPIRIDELDNGMSLAMVTLGERPENYVIGATRAHVNMRKGDSLVYPIIRKVRIGEEVYVIDYNDDATWVKVQVDGSTGWVARYLLSLPQDWQTILMSQQ